VANSFKESLMSRNYNLFSYMARHGNRNWITVNHSKPFLIYTVLTLWFSYFFFSMIAFKSIFKITIWDETRPDLMNVFSFHPLLK